MSDAVDGSIKIGAHLDLKQLEKDISTAKKELAKMQKEQAKLAKKASSQSSTYKKQLQEVNKYRDIYDTKGFREKMKDKGIDYVSDEYTKRLDNYIAQKEKKYSKMISDLNKIETEYIDTANQLEAKNNDITAKSSELAKMNEVLQKATSGTISKFKQLGSSMLNFSKKALVRMVKHVGKLTKNILKAVNPLKIFGKTLKMMFRTGQFMIFGKIFSAIFKQVGEGFANFRKESSAFDASMNEAQSSLTYLGNSIVAAIAPALISLIPIFSSITDAIAGAVNMIAQLTARLTGNATTFTRAKKAQEGYASATDKANKAQKKQLAGFDTIQKISGSFSSNSGSESGSNDMFEEVPIEQGIIDFADRIKDAIAQSDWYSVGYILGEQLAKALDNINWTSIRKKARKIGNNIANLINGFISVPNLGYKIGNAIVQGLNTAFELAYGFVSTLEWSRLGVFIGELITGSVKNFDWSLAGTTIGLLIGGLIQMLSNTIANADIGALFVGIGLFVIGFVNAIADKIRSTDWAQVGQSIGDALYALIFEVDYAGIALALVNLFLQACSGIADLIVGFFEGLAIAAGDGLLGGFLSWMANIFEWLNNNIWQPIYNALLTLFGIEGGNSTYFKSIGEYAMMGLLEGLFAFVTDVLTFFTDMFNNIVLKISEFADNWGNEIEKWWDENVAPWFTLDKWAELGSNAVKGLWKGLKGIGKGLWDAGAEVLSSFAERLGIHSPSTEFFDFATFMNRGLANGIQASIQLVLNALTVLANKMMQMIIDFFKIDDKHSVWFYDKGQKMMQGLIDGFNSMMQALQIQLDTLLNSVTLTMNSAAMAAERATARIAAAAASAEAALIRLQAAESEASSISVSSGPSARTASVLTMDVSRFSIPKLATGDVAMPNRPYLAVLGDNKSEQEVVSPLSTIEQAVRNVMGGGRPITVIMEIDDRQFARAVYKANNQETQRVGVKLAKGGSF